MTLECVDWLRSRSGGVAEAVMNGSQFWLEFGDPATAAEFERIWLATPERSGESLKAHERS